MFPLFETIRIQEGKPLHLKDHQARINYSCLEYFGQLPSWNLKSALSNEISAGSMMKCRLEYNLSQCQFKYTSYQKKIITKLLVKHSHTLEYALKWIDRSGIDQMMDGLNDNEDILIVRDGLFTDSSYANIAFYDGNSWWTPRVPLLPGTCRSRLLAKGVIQEIDIPVIDLYKYKRIKLFNAMIPWQQAIELPVAAIKA